MDNIIETINLTKRYPVIKGYLDLIAHPFRKKEVTALSDVNLTVMKGEVLGLLGSNGAGKTTLLKILCTLILPSSGRATVRGYNVTKDGKEIRKIIGYVLSEERSFYWRLTGRQNLTFFAKLNNLKRVEVGRRVDELIELLDLRDEANRMFKDYSTGMKQRLSIARGLITNPEVLIMDEPTRSLDPNASKSLRDFIGTRLVKEHKKTVIIATHDLNEVAEICDRVAILDKGRMLAVDTIEDLMTKIDTDRSIVVKLRHCGANLLERIYRSSLVKNVKILSDRSNSAEIEIELQSIDGEVTVSNVIKEIIDIGGEINSFYKKEPTLKNLYSKMVSSKNIEIGSNQ